MGRSIADNPLGRCMGIPHTAPPSALCAAFERNVGFVKCLKAYLWEHFRASQRPPLRSCMGTSTAP